MPLLRGAESGDSGISILVINRAAIQRMFLPGGEVYSWQKHLVEEITELAKAQLFPGHGLRTGELRASVDWSVTPSHGALVSNVRATAKHAAAYHEGSRPHHITANPPKRWLRWGVDTTAALDPSGNSSGFYVYRREVWHPGFEGNPFLRDSMNAVLALRGIAL